MTEAEFTVQISRSKPIVMKAIRANLLPRFYESLDDVVQETYLRAFKKISGFKEEAKLSTWLYTIARNEALRMNALLTQKESRENQLLPNLLAPEKEKETSPKIDKQILSTMPKDFLTVYQNALLGMTMFEIASELGVPTGTVKSRLSRAKEWLSRALTN